MHTQRDVFLTKFLIIILTIINVIFLHGKLAFILIIFTLSFFILKLIWKTKYYLMLIPLFLTLLPHIITILIYFNQTYAYNTFIQGRPLFYWVSDINEPYTKYVILFVALLCFLSYVYELVKYRKVLKNS